MEKQTHTIGERAEKFCVACGEERGHVVASVTKQGRISRVTCPKCRTRSTFRARVGGSSISIPVKAGAPYDRTQTYRIGQTMRHPTYGHGEVTGLIEPQKMDVLFADRVRRLIHSRVQA